MRNKKIFGMPIMVLAVVILAVGLGTAALLTYYVDIVGDTTVEQSVVFEDETVSKDYAFSSSASAGETYEEMFTLWNRASVPATVELETSCAATATNCNGINTHYYSILGFEDTQNTTTADVDVEDLGTQIKWTIDVNETNPKYANGHASFGLIIGDINVEYQIHNNDGSDANFPTGTPLVSPYNTTLNSSCAWNGWHSSCVNTEVSTLDWVEVTGDRDLTTNTDGIFTITVDKTKLGSEDFKWVMYLAQDAEFTDSDFSWAAPSITNMHTANIGAEITGPFTLEPDEKFTFKTEFDFAINLQPDTFNIETQVVPVLN